MKTRELHERERVFGKKEAIEFLKSSRMYVGYQDEKDLFKIIKLLQQGEKYKKILGKLAKKMKLGEIQIMSDDKDYLESLNKLF